MAVRVAINGFGRIGRLVLRSIIEHNRMDVEIVGINDLGSPEANAHLLKYDSVHGMLPTDVNVVGDVMTIGSRSIKVVAERDPTKLPWQALGVDICMECTGIFTDKEKAQVHLEAGAKRVLVSAPSKNADLTVVYGVNHAKLSRDHMVVSNASCTTNCLSPVAAVLQQLCGIAHGFMTTIHSYTGDQRTVDTLHKDLRRARASALNMIPTSTGAAKAVGEVLPELKGKLDGVAIRVPTPNVSLVDLKCVVNRSVTSAEINTSMKNAAGGLMKGILAYTESDMVSSDFNHNAVSSTFDATGTKVIDGTFVRVMAWYDNEWGFSTRMSDTAVAWGKII